MRTLYITWLLLTASLASGQQIISGEYFFGNDPGTGNGTGISVAPGSTVSPSISLPVASLGEGFKNISVRFKDSDGKWSQYTQRSFYILNVADVIPQITGAEYFFNEDPGVNNGTAITITPGNEVNTVLALPQDGLPTGFNTVSIRAKDAAGIWSHYAQRVFYVIAVPAIAPGIAAAEYFFDADPGAGNGLSLSLSTTGNVVDQNLSIPASGLGKGFHTLVIRTKDADGNWSHYAQRAFYVMTDAIDAQAVVSAEYFIDTDPGIGAGAPLVVTTPGSSIQQNFVLPTSTGLSNGRHFLFVRMKNDLNKWSVTAVDSFFINTSLPVSGMELSGTLQEGKAVLSWFTYTEENSKSFEVERSKNGISFSATGEVTAAGNSASRRDYKFTDAHPLQGISYYRLKQLDRDGRFEYSNIVVINNSNRNLMTIVPNPSSNIIRLNLGRASTYWRVAIYDAGGKFVQTYKTNDGVLHIGKLPPGSYFLTVTDGLQQFRGTFIKR